MALYARRLTDEDRRRLEDLAFNLSVQPALRQRAMVILLSREGYKTTEIAEQVDLHALNVRKWIHRFNKEGMAGLHDRPRCGRPPKLDMILRRLVWEIVATDPRILGCTFSTWTATRLMRYLRQQDLVEDISYESIRQMFREAQVVSRIHKQAPARPQPQRERAGRPVSALAVAAGTT